MLQLALIRTSPSLHVPTARTHHTKVVIGRPFTSDVAYKQMSSILPLFLTAHHDGRNVISINSGDKNRISKRSRYKPIDSDNREG